MSALCEATKRHEMSLTFIMDTERAISDNNYLPECPTEGDHQNVIEVPSLSRMSFENGLLPSLQRRLGMPRLRDCYESNDRDRQRLDKHHFVDYTPGLMNHRDSQMNEITSPICPGGTFRFAVVHAPGLSFPSEISHNSRLRDLTHSPNARPYILLAGHSRQQNAFQPLKSSVLETKFLPFADSHAFSFFLSQCHTRKRNANRHGNPTQTSWEGRDSLLLEARRRTGQSLCSNPLRQQAVRLDLPNDERPSSHQAAGHLPGSMASRMAGREPRNTQTLAKTLGKVSLGGIHV